MEHYHIYHEDVPDFIREISETEIMKRLKDVGMNCGCEYTSYPRFSHLKPYSRYDHSIGAALIVYHFTKNTKQSVAALLHDIATPVFAHVVDFLKGDYLKQETTEEGTKQIIEESEESQKILNRYGIKTEDVYDYHRYPIADNDPPKLSSDRLEYSLGNIINYEILSEEEVKKIYDDLRVGNNEEGEEEIVFRNKETALLFGKAALECSKIYVADEDRYAMQSLSEVLKYAIEKGVLSEEDLYSTEGAVIEKLLSYPETNEKWINFTKESVILRSDEERNEGKWRKIFAKKRYIDPFILNEGRLTHLYPGFRKELDEFIKQSQEYWICSG